MANDESLIKYLTDLIEKLQSKFDKIPEILSNFEKQITAIKNEFDRELLKSKMTVDNLDCDEHKNRVKTLEDVVIKLKEVIIPDILNKINDEKRENAVRQVYINIGIFIVNLIVAAMIAKYFKG